MNMGGKLDWLVTIGILSSMWRVTLASYVPVYGASSLILYNVTDMYNRFPDVTSITESEYEYFISELNFDAIDGKIITGAADRLYLLDPELGMLDELQWEREAASLSLCSDQNANYACRNHIRVYKRMPTNRDLLFVCGTPQAAYYENSQCRTVDISLGNFSAFSVPVVAADGIISYYPDFSGFGEFRNGDSSDTTYFTAGFFDGPDGFGRHFSISYQKVTFTDTTDPDTLMTTESFRTIDANNFWLRYPVTFVDYYRADYATVAPATSASDYQFYFVFLRENFYDDSSPRDVVLSRVVRICRNDPGSVSNTNSARHFTTYMKARIFCSRNVPRGTNYVGSIDYEYNNMRSMVFNEDGRYYEGGDWVKMMYGSFTGPLNGPLGSALCVYRADNSFENSGSGFDKGIFDIFREDLQDSDTGTEVQNVFTECNPAGRSDSDARNQVLIVRNVDQIGDDPLLVFEGRYISQMVLDQVCVVRSQDETKCLNQDVLFLGTDTGVIMKVVFGTSGTDFIPVIAEDISLDDNNPINEMQLQVVNNTKYLYVSTLSKIYRLPLERCSRGLSCRDCIGSRDPYCVWNTDYITCEASTLTATDEAEGNVPNNIKQNIHTGVTSSVCNFIEVGFDASFFHVNESGNSVQLTISTSTATGLSGYIELYTESGTAEADVDYITQVSSVNFSMGQTEAVVTVDIINDDVYEGSEYFLVRLRDNGVGAITITHNTAIVTILDDDDVIVGFENTRIIVPENELRAELCIRVFVPAHTNPLEFNFSLDPTTLRGVADESDYVPLSPFGTNPLASTQFGDSLRRFCFSVAIIDDNLYEAAEIFRVRLALGFGSPTSRIIVDPDEAIVTILDDDVPFQLRLPMEHCTTWSLEKVQAVMEDIQKETANAISNYCNCSFPANAIASGKLSCRNSPSYVTYRSTISLGQGLSAEELLTFIENWVSTSPTVVVGPYIVDIDSSCTIRFSSLTDPECPTPEIRTLEDEVLITRNPTAISCINKCGSRRGLVSLTCRD